MYKIMLVDDEAGMRNRMLTRIEWGNHGFEIVADAENGVDALEKFEQFVPDVLITDIKMPFMDGFKLSEEVLKNYPLTKIIILTGFDDFDYAKKAIGLNVIDYILKPITHDNIVKVLKKTKEMLDKEYEDKRDVNRLKEYFEKSYPLLRNHVLHQVISGKLSGNIAKSRMDYYNIDITAGPYRVGMIQIKDEIATHKTESYETNKLLLYEIASKVIEEKGFGSTYIYDDFIMLLFTYDKFEDIDNEKLESSIYEVVQYISKFMNFFIKIAIGHKYDDVSKLPLSYYQAKNALDYSNNTQENEVFFIWDVEPNNDSLFLDIRKPEATRAIKTGSIEKSLEIINNIFYEIESSNMAEKDYKLYLLEYVFNIIKNANQLSANIGEDYAEEKILDFLKKSSSLPQLHDWVINLVKTVIDEVTRQRDDKQVDYTKKAIKYIDDNYDDPNMNINKLCQVLYISPTYFCAIFKKNTNSTFTKYLTDVRLERAKELIINTEKKNFEIAALTGFSDANYFSYCFKKNIGVSPSRFRESGKNA